MRWFGRNGRGRRGDPIIGHTSSSGGGDNNYGRGNDGNDGMFQSSTNYPTTATTNPSRHSSNNNNNSGSSMFGMIRNTTSGRGGRDPSMSQDLLRQQQQDVNVYGGPIVDGLVRCLARILPCSESLIGRLLWVCVWGWKVAPVALYETFLRRRPNRNTDSNDRNNDNNNNIDTGNTSSSNNDMNEKGLGFRQYIDTWWKKTFVVPTAFGFYYFLYDYIAQPMVYSVGCCQSDVVTYLAEMSVLAVHFISGVTMHLCEERNRQRKQRQTDFEMQYQHEMNHGLGGNASMNNPSDGIMKNGYHNSTSSPSSSNNQLHGTNEQYRTDGRQQDHHQQQEKPRRIWSLFGGRRGSRRKDKNSNYDDNVNNNVADGSQYPSTTL